MDEKNLLKVALICSIIGILITFIFADKLEPTVMDISDISSSLVEKSVRVQGTVTSLRETSSVLILDVKDDSGSIKVVGFNPEGVILDKGSIVEISGKVTEYKGLLEIDAKKIVSLEV